MLVAHTTLLEISCRASYVLIGFHLTLCRAETHKHVHWQTVKTQMAALYQGLHILLINKQKRSSEKENTIHYMFLAAITWDHSIFL